MEEIKTPTLEKIKAIQRESELFGKFLDWLLQRYTVFDRKQVRDWGFIQLLISFLIIRFIQFKSNIDRLKNLGFNIPIEKSLKEEKKSRDKTVRMIWIITIFCYLMLVLKVGFNYWIYSIGLTILVIDIFLLVMSRVEDNDDNDTENKAR